MLPYLLKIQETTLTGISTVPAVRFRFLSLTLLANRAEPTAPMRKPRIRAMTVLRWTSRSSAAVGFSFFSFAEEKGDYFLPRRSFASSVVSPSRAKNF